VQDSYPPGSGFQLSPRGMESCSRLVSRVGTIVGAGRTPNSVRVLFEGRKTPVTLHCSYITPMLGESVDRTPTEDSDH
jgi:hypothetical protein